MGISEKIQSALEHYKKGNFDQAEILCNEIISEQPDNVQILNILGWIHARSGRYDSARESFEKAIQYDLDNAELYNNLGDVFFSESRFDDAISCYRKALQLDPDFAKGYFNMGLALQEKGQLDDAIAEYGKALMIDENFYEAYYNLGVIFGDKDLADESIQNYQKALHINPDLPEAFHNLGNAYRDKGRLDEAIIYYQKALALNPDFENALNNLGIALQDRGQIEEAIAYFRKALQLNPNLIHAYNNLGNALQDKGQFDDAIICYQKAIELDPDFPDSYISLGTAYRRKGQLDNAIASYQKAIQLNSTFAGAYYNLANTMGEKGQINETLSYYKDAFQFNPSYAEAHFNMSIVSLLSGNFKQGWKEYEWRKGLKGYYQHKLSQPLWDGSDIEGLTILLHAEQGLGDTIHFIRYAPLVAQRGARVIVECQRELSSLLKGVEGIQQVVSRGQPLPKFDLHCPLLSLPLVFDTTIETIPSQIPYIRIDPIVTAKWKEKLKYGNSQLRIGLVWSGNPTHKRDFFRSCRLDTFLPLSDLRGITFYSLQKGEAAGQTKNPPEGMRLLDYTEEINDFLDTAGFIETLDLVISVDTAVTHLAGALGKPVWTLLPFVPDWRWMLNKEDSPWYPTMRLFRQPSPGDWQSVISRVEEALKILISSGLKKANTATN